jgi:hypothetical protein
VIGERRKRCDERLQPQADDQHPVERAGEGADGEGGGDDKVTGDMKDEREVEDRHPDQGDDRTDGEIDPARENREGLPHRQDGNEGEPAHEVLDVAGRGKAWGNEAEERDRQRKECDQGNRGAPDVHLRCVSSRKGVGRDRFAGPAPAAVYQRWEG